MATYRFGNGRDITRKYTFKFNFRAILFSSDFKPGFGNDPTVWQILTVNTGASATFRAISGDDVFCRTLNRGGHFPTDLRNPITGTASIPLYFSIKQGGDQQFYVEDITYIDVNDPAVSLINGIKLGFKRYTKPIDATIEGYIYENSGHTEYISIEEHYPVSKLFEWPDNCGPITIYQNDKPNKDTVRHFPKYTTLNWFEARDPKKKDYYRNSSKIQKWKY